MATSFVSRLVLAVLCLFASAPVEAAPGDLDPTFSGDGKHVDWLSRGDDFGRGVVVQSDGKIVAAGTSWNGKGGYDFAVARYNVDGSLDTTFGTGGKVTTDLNSSYDEAYSVAIQPDGKIVLGGHSDFNFALVRYNADGSLDTTFSSDGKVTTIFNPNNSRAYSVAIDPSGKIVAAGQSEADFAVARYNPDGSADTTFDTDGKVTTDIYSAYDTGLSVAIHADGKIVVGGQAYSQAANRDFFTLVQYNVDGSLDTSFDGDGKVNQPVINGSGRANSVAIQPDGKIVAVGGTCCTSASGNIVGFRYNRNGSVDGQWGADPTIPGSFGYATAFSVAVRTDGKIVTVGKADRSGPSYNVVIMRSNADLSPDLTFGTNGVSITPTDSYSDTYKHAIQPDGMVVVVSDTGSSPDTDFSVLRFNTNGSLDTSFDGDGRVTTDFGGFQGNALHDVAIQPDGKIVSVGTVRDDFAVLRYNADGSPDTTFGSGTGKVRTYMRSYEGAHAVAIQTDGKIVASGGSLDLDGNGCGFTLARYNSDGSLDTTFGSGGRVDTGCYFAPVVFGSAALDIVIQPDGKIVAVGEGYWSDGKDGFLLIRFNANGSLDTSFDSDGKVTTAIESSALASAVALQSDGQIIAAGGSHVGSYYGDASFTLARYNRDGSLDSTFNGDGIVTTAVGSSSYATSVVIQSDGKIVTAGNSIIGSNNDIALVRYNPDGSRDATFDSDGIATTAIGPDEYSVSSISVDGSGKLVVACTSRRDFAVLRYLPNGTLDPTFGGGDGISTVDFGSSYDYASGLALDTTGRATVVGASDGRFAIARLLGGAGLVTISGRVLAPSGQGLRNAVVSLTDQSGVVRTTVTSSFGFYSFENTQAGLAYTISVTSMRYRFTPRTISITETVSDIDLVGAE